MEPTSLTKEESNAKETPKEKTGQSSKVALIICVILAIVGVGFGIYGITRKPEEKPAENNTKDSTDLETELSDIKQKYSILQNYIKELEVAGNEIPEEAKNAATDVSASKNAIINDGSIVFQTKENHADGEKIITINIANGVPSCRMLKSEKDSYGMLAKKDMGECQISGLSGKVQSVYEAGSTQMDWPYLAFLMEDGSVEYAPAFESKETGNIVIKGKINITKFVSGIINNVSIRAGGPEAAGGHLTTMFIHPDGTYTMFADSMIPE